MFSSGVKVDCQKWRTYVVCVRIATFRVPGWLGSVRLLDLGVVSSSLMWGAEIASIKNKKHNTQKSQLCLNSVSLKRIFKPTFLIP